MNASTRTRMVVHSQVQGVGFRAHILDVARRLGLDGYVRNRADGTVEIEAGGTAGNLAQLREAAAAGPPWARVSHVETLEPGAAELPRPFSIRR